MRLSRFFLPILREAPREAEIVSHRLMLRAGLIRQTAAGIYAWLPLGHRVLLILKRGHLIAKADTPPAGERLILHDLGDWELIVLPLLIEKRVV